MRSNVTLALEEVEGLSFKRTIKILCAEELDYGLFRDVYVLKKDRRFVVKIERDTSCGQFANVTEWRNYIDNRDWDEFGKYLAPCETITRDGRFLIQRRIYRYKCRKYPERIPSLFTDTKITNFGWIGKQFVCCDYSYLLTVGRFYMKKAKWWDVNSSKDCERMRKAEEDFKNKK